MSASLSFSRRQFMQATGAGCVIGTVGLTGVPAASPKGTWQELGDRRLLKTLKIGMVGAGDTLADKFRIVRDAGFDGVEMDSPGMTVEETRNAIEKSSLPVDGTVCSTHWNVRHSDPNPEVRAAALRDLKSAIRDTHAVGGNTVLLVVGHGKDGNEDEVWSRSIENISKAIPLSANLGVFIAIENVWNHFLYDHEGGSEQSAEKFVRYVDALNSPWVGMQFDIGNHWKYANAGDWIRMLGKRIVKLDAKGYSRARQAWTPIGEGDIDWGDVRKALQEINYCGWVAAEVDKGDAEYLKGVAAQMDTAFGIPG
jgi:hexulose-6-phosphate isomerase